jgi:dihydroorotase
MKSKLLLCLFFAKLPWTQTYDLVIKGRHIIDPANRIDAVSDIAIAGNQIARLAQDTAP